MAGVVSLYLVLHPDCSVRMKIDPRVGQETIFFTDGSLAREDAVRVAMRHLLGHSVRHEEVWCESAHVPLLGVFVRLDLPIAILRRIEEI
jgi:hypothetical protein